MATVNEQQKPDRPVGSASPATVSRRRKVALRPNPRLVGNYEGSSRTIDEVRRQIEKQQGASA
jgi:hypothetical protein